MMFCKGKSVCVYMWVEKPHGIFKNPKHTSNFFLFFIPESGEKDFYKFFFNPWQSHWWT